MEKLGPSGPGSLQVPVRSSGTSFPELYNCITSLTFHYSYLGKISDS